MNALWSGIAGAGIKKGCAKNTRRSYRIWLKSETYWRYFFYHRRERVAVNIYLYVFTSIQMFWYVFGCELDKFYR
ncbi:hypothetical protein PSSHI_13320 [Photobacterium sp. R1]